MCSFHKPEPYQPSHAWPMPPNVPSPEECELQEIIWAREAIRQDLDERTKRVYQMFIEVGDALCLLDFTLIITNIFPGANKESDSLETSQVA